MSGGNESRPGLPPVSPTFSSGFLERVPYEYDYYPAPFRGALPPYGFADAYPGYDRRPPGSAVYKVVNRPKDDMGAPKAKEVYYIRPSGYESQPFTPKGHTYIRTIKEPTSYRRQSVQNFPYGNHLPRVEEVRSEYVRSVHPPIQRHPPGLVRSYVESIDQNFPGNGYTRADSERIFGEPVHYYQNSYFRSPDDVENEKFRGRRLVKKCAPNVQQKSVSVEAHISKCNLAPKVVDFSNINKEKRYVDLPRKENRGTCAESKNFKKKEDTLARVGKTTLQMQPKYGKAREEKCIQTKTSYLLKNLKKKKLKVSPPHSPHPTDKQTLTSSIDVDAKCIQTSSIILPKKLTRIVNSNESRKKSLIAMHSNSVMDVAEIHKRKRVNSVVSLKSAPKMNLLGYSSDENVKDCPRRSCRDAASPKRLKSPVGGRVSTLKKAFDKRTSFKPEGKRPCNWQCYLVKEDLDRNMWRDIPLTMDYQMRGITRQLSDLREQWDQINDEYVPVDKLNRNT